MAFDLVEQEVDVAELQVGMHVVRLDRPWEETDFLLQGFVIQSPEDIHSLQAQCQRVVIEGRLRRDPQPVRGAVTAGPRSGSLLQRFTGRAGPRASDATSTPAPSKSVRKRVVYINKVDVGQEMEAARLSYSDAKSLASGIMAGLRLGRALDLNQVRTVVDSCVDSILRNDDALLWLTKLKNRDEYTAEHSLNVSILSAAFGKHLGMLEEEIRTLALCGMLHDIGKARMPAEILQKPGALTPEEHAVMRTHPAAGRDILMGLPKVVRASIDVAYNHHERLDGRGYPRGLTETRIPYLAKVVAIVDTYDAITSSRVYDRGRSSMEALRILYRCGGTQFDADLVKEFIRMIGIYPPGSIVEMNNGEVGIVVSSHPRNKRKPRVMLIRSADKQPLADCRLLDMMVDTTDTAGREYNIARELPDGSHGIALREFIDSGIISGYPGNDSGSRPSP